MFEIAFKWVAENYPLLFIIAILIFSAVWITSKAKDFYHRLEGAETECEKIEGKITPSLLAIDKSINGLDKSAHALITFLTTKHPDLKLDLLIKTNSPVQLTDLGSEILLAIGGKKYIDENTIYLINELSKESIKSALDVENYARIVLIREYSKDSFTPIKNYIYQNPEYKSGDKSYPLDLATISNLMGIYLRDKYFEVHPELINAGA